MEPRARQRRPLQRPRPAPRSAAALATGVLAAVMLAGCSGGGAGGTEGSGPGATSSSSPSSPDPASPSPSSPAATAAALERARVDVPDALATFPFDSERTLMAPAGWSVSVIARVDGARHMAWTPDGRLLVSRPKDGRVVALTPADDRGAATADVLVDGLRQPHGLAFDGDTLYVAESNRLDAYPYADGRVGERVTVVDDLPDAKSTDLEGAYAHALKSVAVGDDGDLYVSVGSTGNVSAEDRAASPERAVVLRVPAGTRGADAADVEVFSRGVRNGTALAVAPDGEVWTAVNNRDNLAYPFHRAYDTTADGDGGDDFGEVVPDYVDDHPPEPLARLTAGRDLGWPFCTADASVDPGVEGSALDFGSSPFAADAILNEGGDELDCSSLPRIEQGLPAHSAPLGMSFTEVPGIGAGALVAAHGSWNATPPQEPFVSFFPYADGAMGDRQELLTGWQDESGERFGRPVAVVPGPDGALYVSDDTAGTIYRVETGS